MKFSTAAFIFSGLASLVSGAAVTTTASATVTHTKTIYTTDTTTATRSKTIYSYDTTTATRSKTIHTTITSTVTRTYHPTSTKGLCLNTDSASYLVNGFASLLTAYDNNTANALLASDFTDTSDSINYLAGIPLGSVTFGSKAAFMAGQGSQPAIGFQVLGIDAIGCTTIGWRWTAFLGTYPVKGIEIFYASNLNGTQQGWQIETLYSEFDVGAWELDIGSTCGNGATVA